MESAGSIFLDLFWPEELTLPVAGQEELDFNALEAHTRCEEYTATLPGVRTFWSIAYRNLTDDDKKIPLSVTACLLAPINGFGAIPFAITRDSERTHRPTSRTCFFALMLPDDPDEHARNCRLR
jgi:hypothetical protein